MYSFVSMDVLPLLFQCNQSLISVYFVKIFSVDHSIGYTVTIAGTAFIYDTVFIGRLQSFHAYLL